jgi:hypothetical protein
MHEPAVYADVAGQLRDEGVEIEAHRLEKTVAYVLPGAESGVPQTKRVRYDTIRVMSIGGEAVAGAREVANPEDHVERLYPPEADPSDGHNLSLEA